MKAFRPYVVTALVAVVGATAAACGSDSSSTPTTAARPAGSQDCNKHFRVGFMPKQTADPFFVAANRGAQAAADQLGMEVVYKGPPNPDPAGQSQIITQWTQQRLDAISVSANDPNALAPALKQAASAGVKVSAWNADVATDAREFFMDNPPAAVLGETLVEQTVSSTGPKAKILVMTSSLQSPNQNQFLNAVKDYAAKKYPDLVIQKVLPGESDTSKSFNIAKSWLQAHPETSAILTVDGSELAGGAQAVNQLGKKGKVTLVGIGVPSQNGKDLLSGTVKAVVLWNPMDLGYATIYMMHAQLCGKLKAGQTSFDAGRLGQLKFTGRDTITLGKALVFTKQNVHEFNF
jgi:rhamnose transport system substrate-binding protein